MNLQILLILIAGASGILAIFDGMKNEGMTWIKGILFIFILASTALSIYTEANKKDSPDVDIVTDGTFKNPFAEINKQDSLEGYFIFVNEGTPAMNFRIKYDLIVFRPNLLLHERVTTNTNSSEGMISKNSKNGSFNKYTYFFYPKFF